MGGPRHATCWEHSTAALPAAASWVCILVFCRICQLGDFCSAESLAPFWSEAEERFHIGPFVALAGPKNFRGAFAYLVRVGDY